MAEKAVIPPGLRRLAAPKVLPWTVAAAVLALNLAMAAAFDLPQEFNKYPVAARQAMRDQLPDERRVDFSPLYLGLSRIAVRSIPEPGRALEGLQLVLAAAAAGFLAALLRRRFSSRLTWLAIALLVLDRRILIYQRILEPETCLLFLLLGSLVFLERTASRAPGRAAWLDALGAGLFAAAALATRPTFLPLYLAAPVVLGLRGVRGADLARRSAAVLAPVAVALVLLAARSSAATGDPWSPVMNPGTVFFEGNNPLSAGTSAVYPPLVLVLAGSERGPDVAHQIYRDVARADAGEPLGAGEVNAFWLDRGLRFLRAEPGHGLRLLLGKLLRSFHNYRWHDLQAAVAYDHRILVPPPPFAAVSALALLGLLLERRRWRETAWLYLAGAMQLAVLVAFYVSARQQVILLPILVYFAAATLERIGRGGRPAWILAGIALALAVTLHLPDDLTRDEAHQRRGDLAVRGPLGELRYGLAKEPLAWHPDLVAEIFARTPWWLDWRRPSYYPQDEHPLEAAVAARIAARPAPTASDTFDLAVMTLEAGRADEAEALFASLAAAGRRVYRQSRQPSDPLFYLGRIAARRGDRRRGVKLLERALERSPGDPFVLAELVALTDDARYQEPLGSYFSQLDAQYFLGRSLLAHGRDAEAVAAFGYVVRRLPALRSAKVYLAAALGRTGQVDRGAELYLEAVGMRPDPVLRGRDLAELFRRWARRHPGQPQVQQLASRTLFQLGYPREALELLAPLEPSPRVEADARKIRRALAGPG